MERIKSITFDKETQDNLPQHIKDKMKADRNNARKKTESKGLNIPVVVQRTFLFSGWYAGEKFEIKIKAVDRESAITDFETTWVHHKWHMTQEIDQYVAQQLTKYTLTKA